MLLLLPVLMVGLVWLQLSILFYSISAASMHLAQHRVLYVVAEEP